MVTLTGKYALRILAHLADRRGEWIQGREIAKATGIPANYLSKILNQLRKRGFVLSQKGWGGGFMLEEAAAEIPILEVLELFEGPRDGKECVFGLHECDETAPCPLHPYWEQIRKSYDGMLHSISIGELQPPKEKPKTGRRR